MFNWPRASDSAASVITACRYDHVTLPQRSSSHAKPFLVTTRRWTGRLGWRIRRGREAETWSVISNTWAWMSFPLQRCHSRI